jgi:hypothetical protein
MTVKIDGTNGVLQAYDYQVLTTGFSYTFAAGTQVLVAVPAGTLATGTVTMPSAPADGMVITIQSTQQITALTLNGNTGQSIVGNAVQIVPNQPLSWVYRLTNTTWYPMAGGIGRASPLVIGTSVASTSGVAIDFTSIPSWVKRITVMFNGVSTSGTSNPLIQIGTGGSATTSGYLATSANISSSAASQANYTTGFGIGSSSAANVISGVITIFNVSGNIWIASGVTKNSTTAAAMSAGDVTLAGVLNIVRITTVNGTDTFDAGSVNIQYE